MSKATEFLNNNQSATPSKWREAAEWRRKNEKWLKYARVITMKTMQAMDKQSVTQSILAKRMGCSQQYVSNLLKGSSNMTLETISRIETALNIDLIGSALSSLVDGYDSAESSSRTCYLNDVEQPALAHFEERTNNQ
ncbi:MAG: helix-turn-helix transcriptional regulator [Bacteroidales bacterium]|jgi:plasmid maintenance system antidote protein VapI|nr:helix-turn-helix transcriptional regulator [Bacteroidales bacterium]